MFANTEQPNSQLHQQLENQLASHSNGNSGQQQQQLPSHESASGTDFRPTHGGVGTLPGGREESGVARLPEERGGRGTQTTNPITTVPGTAEPLSSTGGANMHNSYDQSRMQNPTNTVPGTAEPLPSTGGANMHNSYDQSHMQKVTGQQETANANAGIPGTRGSNFQGQTQTRNEPSIARVEQVEGDPGHHNRDKLSSYDQSHMQKVTGQQETANANAGIPGTRGSNPQTQAQTHNEPSTARVEQVEGDPGHHNRDKLSSYDQSHMQKVSGQQESANANANAGIPGTRGSNPQTHNEPSTARAEQVEGDPGHHDSNKPSIGQRVKQGIKEMTSGLKK